MTNFYDILGIKQSASHGEIKTAFRSLAKVYHPDKNPAGQEHFKKILLAYETLINPNRKYSYDLKLKYHQNASTTHTTGNKTKNWSFEEKEMKRRQYYNEHIKKYEKASKAKAQHAELKQNYNEYKYILYATPIAVALFLLVINFATPSHKTYLNSPESSPPLVKKSPAMGDSPYSEYFGTEQFFAQDNKNLVLKNQTGYDMIACLFSGKDVVRCCFIASGYYAEIPQLPAKPIDIRYFTGKAWDYDQAVNNGKVKGTFTSDTAFYKSKASFDIGSVNELTIAKGTNEDFEQIDEKEFFNKEEINTSEKHTK